MHWPIQRLEIQRRFVPRFCPRRDCPQHALTGRERLRFQRFGSFRRADGRRVPRFRCSVCQRSFSKQTFAVSYYLKRPELLLPVAAGLQAGSAHRQLARSLGCAASTVTRLSARLGRHALLLHVLALEHLSAPDRALVLDHMEVFARAQDYPFGVATVVGHRSWFVYSLDPAPHARTGRRSPHQEAVWRRRPRQDSKGGRAASVRRALDPVLPRLPESTPTRLLTDGDEDYARTLRRSPYRDRLRHEIYPNPKRGPKGAPRSPEARRRDAAMFPNDLLHGLLRHSLAHHRRETIAFGRRLNAVMERLFLAAAWRNFVKDVSERRPRGITPAMRAGVTTAPWSWARVLARRLFPDRLQVPASWLELYRREWDTPGGPNSRHRLALAY